MTPAIQGYRIVGGGPSARRVNIWYGGTSAGYRLVEDQSFAIHLCGLLQAPHAAGRAGTPDLFICSGQVNCPGIKLLAFGQNAWTAQAPPASGGDGP
ncbi:hypothetical protein B5G40_00545 [Flavonifractor sp. An9]|nr:hypothetical protein B5G40_00545 [Flavonifractor sp. An9]